ncbi:GYD domain-containing protein [Frateuria sp. GZRe12]|uniref:GYD domain-containing protein n=1 Tax=Frateuria sp. GZRe12 TaxID=3351533 RepID=UPI003EDC779D
MPTFITQGRYTTDAIRSMVSHPQDRSKEVEKLFAATGGKLLGYYMTFGDYDFLVVSEGPDEGVAVSTIAAAAAGGVTDLKTVLAIPGTAMADAFRRAASVASGFRGPMQGEQAQMHQAH